MGWIFPKWIRLFWICKLLSDKLWCKEYRKTNSTGTVQHLYTSIPVGGAAGRSDFLYWNLRRRGAGNAYRNLCRQWSDTDILHELVFIDIRMPGLDGNQTALKLRNYNKDAVLIFYSSYFEPTVDSINFGQPFRYIMKDLHDTRACGMWRIIWT